MLAPWIVSHFAKHKVYTEVYGGAASCLLRKERSYAEIYNDLDSDIVNLFQVVRDRGSVLIELLRNTPFSRAEFEQSYEIAEDSMERARRTVVRSFMGFGSASASMYKTGFRANAHRSGGTPARDWMNYPDALVKIVERLRGVCIEKRNAIEVLKQHDRSDTLHYLDPPYVLSTRHKGVKTKQYLFEMTDDDHTEMLREVKKLQGMCLISGYANELYEEALPDWSQITKETFADGAKKRIEVLYLNPRLSAALEIEKMCK